MTTRLEREMSAIACTRPMPVSTSVAKIGPSRRTTCDSCWYATNLKRLPALQKSQLEWLLAIFQLSIRIFWRNFTRYSDIISDIVDPSPYVLETGRKIVFLFRDVSKLKEQWSRQAETISNVTSLDFCGHAQIRNETFSVSEHWCHKRTQIIFQFPVTEWDDWEQKDWIWNAIL